MFTIWNPHSGFGVFLPVLEREFGWSRGEISLTASLNLLIGGVLVFALGAASDRYGPRAILGPSAFLVGALYLAASATTALWQFYLLLGVLMGLAMSPIYLVPTATVSRWFVSQRGLALGVLLAGHNLGVVTGGPLAAFLINAFGWRTAYLLLGGLVWAVAIPASLFTRHPPAAGGASAPPRQQQGTRSTSVTAREATFREALADRRFWLLAGSWFLLASAHIMVSVHIVSYVKDRGVALEHASLALTIYGLSLIGGKLLLGAVCDRLGATLTFWVCAALQVLGLGGVLTGPRLWALYLLIACFGLGAAGADTCVVAAVSEVFGVRAIGAILGTMNVGWRFGAALGPAAAGFIYDGMGSYTVAFGLASAGLLVSVATFTLAMSPVRLGSAPGR